MISIIQRVVMKDGGESWETISIPNEFGANDVSMIDSNHIWVTTSIGEIYGTDDGGQTWDLQFYDQSKTNYMNYVEMFDLNNGVAMGDCPTNEDPALFLRTTDGGENWISMNDTSLIGVFSGDTWRRLDFVDLDVGYFYVSGPIPEYMARTMDGGASWTKTSFPKGAEGANALKFYNSEIGMTVEHQVRNYPLGSVFRTTDEGVTWENADGIPQQLYWGNDIEFIPGNPAKVWMTDHPNLYFSDDTGKTWIRDTTFDFEIQGRDIVFTDETHGWVLCDDGLLLKKTKDGFIWSSIEKKQILPKSFVLKQNYPNPFNPSTVIRYQVGVNGHSPVQVDLSIYNVLGQKVVTLVSARQPAGEYQVDWDASSLASGIYLYRLEARGLIQSKKMLLLR